MTSPRRPGRFLRSRGASDPVVRVEKETYFDAHPHPYLMFFLFLSLSLAHTLTWSMSAFFLCFLSLSLSLCTCLWNLPTASHFISLCLCAFLLLRTLVRVFRVCSSESYDPKESSSSFLLVSYSSHRQTCDARIVFSAFSWRIMWQRIPLSQANTFDFVSISCFLTLSVDRDVTSLKM
ncbi:hypothetical protein MARPO_0055s0053 [Marchantia polymorpha]|uniref:Transmembrane protein n=1 Tax=Marchantia polymorpha TaxID=3197 RepID=A0A2R6WV94_MARPO|nr:hypothetical protein MARPO_0055s0053 [Marchantia polymorpha]|eukprot:PTQ37777.1 hypothetical protein MARPO_0055s0053 [Marchantia polymorpha]